MITELPSPSRGPGPLQPAAGCDCGRCPFYTGNPAAAGSIAVSVSSRRQK